MSQWRKHAGESDATNPERGLGRLWLCWQDPVSYTHLDVYKRQALLTLGGAALGTWTAALVGSTVEDPVRRRFEEEIEAGRILLVADGEDPALSVASAAIIATGARALPFEMPSAIS